MSENRGIKVTEPGDWGNTLKLVGSPSEIGEYGRSDIYFIINTFQVLYFNPSQRFALSQKPGTAYE